MSRQLIIEKSKNSPPYQGGARGGLTIISVLFLLLSTSLLHASPIPGGDDDTGGTGETGGTGGTGGGPGVGPGDDDQPQPPSLLRSPTRRLMKATTIRNYQGRTTGRP